MNETNGDGKMPLQCGCGQKWSYSPRTPEIFNSGRTSGVTLDHSALIRCPSAKCHQPYLLVIENVQVMLGVRPIDETVATQIEGSPIVKPSLSLIN